MCLSPITVVLGLKSGEEALKGVPTFSGNEDGKEQEKHKDNAGAQLRQGKLPCRPPHCCPWLTPIHRGMHLQR